MVRHVSDVTPAIVELIDVGKTIHEFAEDMEFFEWGSVFDKL